MGPRCAGEVGLTPSDAGVARCSCRNEMMRGYRSAEAAALSRALPPYSNAIGTRHDAPTCLSSAHSEADRRSVRHVGPQLVVLA